jgi:hypothetical protein
MKHIQLALFEGFISPYSLWAQFFCFLLLGFVHLLLAPAALVRGRSLLHRYNSRLVCSLLLLLLP